MTVVNWLHTLHNDEKIHCYANVLLHILTKNNTVLKTVLSHNTLTNIVSQYKNKNSVSEVFNTNNKSDLIEYFTTDESIKHYIKCVLEFYTLVLKFYTLGNTTQVIDHYSFLHFMIRVAKLHSHPL